MPGLTRRVRSVACRAGMLLGLAAIAAADLEHLSFGHHHLGGGHAVHHHHVSSGPHEHRERLPGHDDRETPAQDDAVPRRTGTFSSAPALFQPVGVSVLEAPLTVSAPVVAVLVPRLRVPAAFQPSSPRGPPASGIGTQKEMS